MWDDLAPWAAGGGVGIFLWFIVAMVKISVGAERRRADGWQETARIRETANDVMADNMQKLIASLGELATSQREILALVRSLATERRSAA